MISCYYYAIQLEPGQLARAAHRYASPHAAVIKIEIDSLRTDRIFLHQHDEDLRLAQEFVAKHRLDPAIASHIYERIAFSRRSVEANNGRPTATPPPNNANLHPQQVTPYQNLYSQREELLSHR